MPVKPEQRMEKRPALLRIGTLEHIETYANLASGESIETAEELKDYLQEHHIAESLAYFIFDYQTRETRRFWVPERTAVIDTRGLTGYETHWPSLYAEYHYEPLLDRNYLHISGEPTPGDSPEPGYDYNYKYQMHIPLSDALDLDIHGPLEAHMQFGDAVNPKEIRSFRSYAHTDPRYKSVRDPALFIKVLQKTAIAFRDYLYRRDYL